jgi:hypothetical protein
MGYLKHKTIKGNTYLYQVESNRINGKPTIVNQKYIGPVSKLLETPQDAEKSSRKRVLYSVADDYGMVALLYDLAVRLNLVGIIYSFVPKRCQGVTVGMYILIEAIKRVVAPTSTTEPREWYMKTRLPKMTNIKASAFTAQNCLNNASNISEEALEDI